MLTKRPRPATSARLAEPGRERAMPKVTLETFDRTRDSGKLLRWLAQPHVAQWWGDAARAMQNASECASESHALNVADGTPVGYLCWQHPPKEELEAADLADLPSGLIDIDILIGDPELLGRGIASRLIDRERHVHRAGGMRAESPRAGVWRSAMKNSKRTWS